jgi:hypothetical protein
MSLSIFVKFYFWSVEKKKFEQNYLWCLKYTWRVSIVLHRNTITCSIIIVRTITILRYYENATLFSTLFLGRL